MLVLVLGLTGLLSAAGASGQSQPAGDDDVVAPLVAEVQPARRLFNQDDPVRIRFILTNPTDEPVELPIMRPRDTRGIRIPESLIFGTTDEPALFLSFRGEAEMPLLAPPPAEGLEPDTLRLAPHASIGTDVDLRRTHRQMRYAGNFRLVWRPFGRTSGASADFRIESRKHAVIVTDHGKLTFELFYDDAPRNVVNFLDLARRHFYDGTNFHRIIPEFIIQGGSPDGTPGGIRPDGELIPAEFHDAPFRAGTLAMARKPDEPDSASCQFFISLARLEELDGEYSVIGQAVDEESLRTLDRLAQIPTDAQHRPIRPVVIRFVTLVDAPTEREPNRDLAGP